MEVNKRYLGRGLLIMTGLLLPSLIYAQTITLLSNGRVVKSPEFDNFPHDEVDVQLEVSLVGAANTTASNYSVGVSGSQAYKNLSTCSTGVVADTYDCLFTVGMGPGIPSWGPHPFGTPYRYFYTNTQPVKPAFSTLTDLTSGHIVAADRAIYFDGRVMEQETNSPITETPSIIELTANGFPKLNSTHREPLPLPSLDEFNQKLSANLANVDAAKTISFDPQDAPACFDLTSIKPGVKRTDLRDIPSFKTIFTEADAAFIAWGVAFGFCTSPLPVIGSCNAAKNACVKTPATTNNFEVCFDSLSAEMTEQSIGGINLVDLRLGSSDDTLEADFELADNSGLLEIEILQDNAFIRYKKEDVCFPRPRQNLPTQEINLDPQLADWASCPASRVTADKACSTCIPDYPNSGTLITSPAVMSIDTAVVDNELMDIQQTSGALMFQTLGKQIAGGSLCNDPAVKPTVEALLDEYIPEMHSNLNATWKQPVTSTGYHDIVGNLLSPMEIGKQTQINNYEPNLAHIDLKTRQISGISNTFATSASDVLSTTPDASVWVSGNPPTLPLHPDGEIPGTTDKFDISYSLTTSYLNQVIAAQAADILSFEVQPTNGELGVAGDSNAVAILNGTNLGTYFPPFGQIGNDIVTISITPELTPFTWMKSDGLDYEQVRYYVPALRVTMASPTHTWLSFYMDKLNDPLQIDFSHAVQDPFLAIDPGTPFKWENVITHSSFTNPQGALGDPCGFDDILANNNGCGQSMIAKMRGLILQQLEQRSFDMLGEITAPQYYDQAGTSYAPKTTALLDRKQRESYITLYGEFREAILPDADSDGIADGRDNCPDDGNEDQVDLDGDGAGDVCDPDADGDSINDTVDNCPTDYNPDQANSDAATRDSDGDACDDDDDADGILDDQDNCPVVANPGQENRDSGDDNVGDACDDDQDNDGIADPGDNCASLYNPYQSDNDNDKLGDDCDSDDDNDKVADAQDNCPLDPNSNQNDIDKDGLGDICDADSDNDSFADDVDNCPAVYNLLQLDTDGDKQGNSCDTDDDGDGIDDLRDNCPLVKNTRQLDTDSDRVGDLCDNTPFGKKCSAIPVDDLLNVVCFEQ